LFDGYDVNQLVDLMTRVWTDDGLRNNMIEKGFGNVVRFNWRETARQTILAYQKSIKQALECSQYQRFEQKSTAIKSFSQRRPTVFIVTHIRFYPPAAGNEQRLFKLVRYLKKLGYQIIMLVNSNMEKEAISNLRRQKMHQYVDYYEEVSDYPGERYIPSSKGLPTGQSNLLEKWESTEHGFCPDEMMARARQLIGKFSPKIILAEYIWTSRIFEMVSADSLKVIDLHDLFSQKQDHVIKHGIKDDLALTTEEEIEFINRANIVVAIQDIEAEKLRSLHPKCEVISAGIDYENRTSRTSDESKHVVLVIGSDNQINRKCVNEFLNAAWPDIYRMIPDCILKIVGNVSGTIQGIHRNVELIAYAEDLGPLYNEATIVVNPVYAGTGLKIKSVEALGHGKALIAWPEGISGINLTSDDKPFVVVDSWDKLALESINLIKDAGKRLKLEKLAKEYSRDVLSDQQVYKQVGDRFDTHSIREIKILCLYLRYGPNDYPGSLEKLMGWYQLKQQTSNVSLTLWVIDNIIEQEYDGIDIESGFRLISGNNSQREFSGFQKIIEKYREDIESYDVVHFVTSAFDQLFNGYLEYFDLNHLYPVLHRSLCLGHIDSYDQPIKLLGFSSQCWIRTGFFFISPHTLYSLNDVVAIKDKTIFFNDLGNFLNNGNIDEVYIQYLKQWLYGEQLQGVVWHGRIKTDNDFAEKALSILNEHMLSIRLRTIGVHLVDYYWLKNNLENVEKAYGFSIPEEIEQVRFRQKSLFNN